MASTTCSAMKFDSLCSDRTFFILKSLLMGLNAEVSSRMIEEFFSEIRGLFRAASRPDTFAFFLNL